MPFVKCPSCGSKLSLLPRQLGNPMTCPDCGHLFTPARRRDDADDAPARKPAVAPAALGIIRGIVWALCLLWSGAVAAVYLVMLSGSAGAVQEAAAGTMACFGVIFGYVCARAIDSATRW